MLSIICYVFEIGYSTKIYDGKVIRKFSWKYPLAISLVVWLFWHFYLYPPTEELIIPPSQIEYSKDMEIGETSIPKTNKLMAQKINMVNWN
jgi:hypothetical protein